MSEALWSAVFLGSLDGKSFLYPCPVQIFILTQRHDCSDSNITCGKLLQQIRPSFVPRNIVPTVSLLLYTSVWPASRYSRPKGRYVVGSVLLRYYVPTGSFASANRLPTGLGTVLCGLAPSMNALIAARAIAGMGGGGSVS